jgi:S-adenosylmethionine synthetase
VYIDVPDIVRGTITEIGYTDSKFGIDGDTCGVITAIQEQSPDIAQGVDHAMEEREKGSGDRFDVVGAGDQGMMFGFACRETDELMPMPIAMAQRWPSGWPTSARRASFHICGPTARAR